jgi:hypothetical protein
MACPKCGNTMRLLKRLLVLWANENEVASREGGVIHALQHEASDVPCLNRSKLTVVGVILTPWSRFLLEKLAGSQLMRKFPTFYGI